MNDLGLILKSKIGSKNLLVVFPHPDDESMGTGGVLILAKQYGWQTTVATLTSGEKGQCHINSSGRKLSEIRNEELTSATEILMVDKLVHGDFSDAELRNDASRVEIWLKELLDKEKPDMIFTYDLSGFTGHPDHIQLSLSVLKIIKSLKSKPDLFWVSVPKFLSKFLVNKKVINYFSTPTHKLNLGISWCKKLVAVKKHRSQRLDNGKPLLFLYLAIIHTEWYHKADLSRDYKYKFVDFKI